MHDTTVLVLVWSLPIAFSLHVFEEFALPGGLKQWIRAYKPGKPKGDFHYIFVNAIGFVVALIIALKASDVSVYRIFLFFTALMGANAVSHIRGTIQKKQYCPGTASGGLLLIPLFVISYWYFLSTGRADWNSALVCLIFGVVVGFYVMGVDIRKMDRR
jgi:hypothetical protein